MDVEIAAATARLLFTSFRPPLTDDDDEEEDRLDRGSSGCCLPLQWRSIPNVLLNDNKLSIQLQCSSLERRKGDDGVLLLTLDLLVGVWKMLLMMRRAQVVLLF